MNFDYIIIGAAALQSPQILMLSGIRL